MGRRRLLTLGDAVDMALPWLGSGDRMGAEDGGEDGAGVGHHDGELSIAGISKAISPMIRTKTYPVATVAVSHRPARTSFGPTHPPPLSMYFPIG